MANERRVLLVGKVGSGKSSTGNSLIGMPYFNCANSNFLVTKACEKVNAKSPVNNHPLWVVDTPGFFSWGSKPQGTAVEILRYLEDNSFKPHAVLLIFRLDDNDVNQEQTISMLKLVFGDQIFKHCIVVFTHSVKGPADEENIPLTDIVVKCDGRVTQIKNSASNEMFEVPTEDIGRIMTLVDNVSELGKNMYIFQTERRQVLEESGSDEHIDDLPAFVELLEHRLFRRRCVSVLKYVGQGMVIVALTGIAFSYTKNGIKAIAKDITADVKVENKKLMVEMQKYIVEALNQKFEGIRLSTSPPVSGKHVSSLKNGINIANTGLAGALGATALLTGNPLLGAAALVWGMGTLGESFKLNKK